MPEDLYRRYAPALIRKAQRMLRNEDDAIDVVQGLFTDLVGTDLSGITLAYLYRAVTNRCLSLIRDTTNRQRLLELQAPALRGTERTRCDNHAIGFDLLLKLSDQLDETLMETLTYRFLDDMTQQEIAAQMDVSRKTVGHRLRRIEEAVALLVDAEVSP